MVFSVQLTVPSAAQTQLSQCVNPDRIKDREVGKLVFKLLRLVVSGQDVCTDQLKVLFLDADDEGLMCDGRSLASPFRRLAGRGFFCVISCFNGSYTLRSICFAVLLCMNHHPSPGKILLVIVVAHAISKIACFSLLCGFVAANL